MSTRSPSHRSHSSRSTSTENWSKLTPVPWPQRVVDLCLIGAFWCAPFCMGGREPLGQLVLALFAAIASLAWGLHQLRTPAPRLRFTGAELFLLLGVGIVILQVLPLPQSLLAQLSPKLPELIPVVWGDGDPALGLPPWSTLSLTPYVTLSYLGTMLTCVALYFILAQRVQSWQDVQHLVVLLAAGGVLMALFGLLQFATSNGKYFWIYHHVQASTKFAAVGGFTNANHFADFLAMTVPLQIWLFVQQLRAPRPRSHRLHKVQTSWREWEIGGMPVLACAVLLGLCVTGLAILLSMSRGGILLTLGGAAITLSLFWWRTLLNTRVTAMLGVAAIVGVGATLLFGDLAGQMIEQNIAEISSQDLSQLDKGEARRRIWAANWQGIQEFPLIGTGLGSHPEVYYLWYDFPDNGKMCSHAESGYLQVGLETGLAGISVVGTLWLLLIWWCLRVYFGSQLPEVAGLGAAVLAAVAINLGHSITDFVWYCPACVVVMLGLGVAMARVCGLRPEELSPSPPTDNTERSTWHPVRLTWLMLLPGLLLGAIWIVPLKWRETVAFSKVYAHRMYTETLLDEKEQKETGADEKLRLHRLQTRAAIDSVAANPWDHLQQERAGTACEKLFILAQSERTDSMPLIHLQDAARASGFTKEELSAWLDKPGVLGENRQLVNSAMQHFRESLRQCPLQGKAYLELAGMIWTEGASREDEQRLLDQALLARPYDSRVLYAFGYRISEEQGLEAAMPYLQKGFDNGPRLRKSLMTAYAPLVPAAFFLDNFQLDRTSLIQLEEAYREAPDRYGYQKVAGKLAQASVLYAVDAHGLEAEEAWLTAHRCFVTLGQNRKAYKCGQAALESNPTSFAAHQALGMWLFDQQKYAAAAEHLLWCHRRKPDIDWIRTLTEQAMARSHDPGGSPAPVDQRTEIQPASATVVQ